MHAIRGRAWNDADGDGLQSSHPHLSGRYVAAPSSDFNGSNNLTAADLSQIRAQFASAPGTRL